MELVAHLRLEDLDHGGQHPLVGHLTVDEIISDWVHQDRNHFKQMLTNIQDYANDGEREEVLGLALSVGATATAINLNSWSLTGRLSTPELPPSGLCRMALRRRAPTAHFSLAVSRGG